MGYENLLRLSFIKNYIMHKKLKPSRGRYNEVAQRINDTYKAVINNNDSFGLRSNRSLNEMLSKNIVEESTVLDELRKNEYFTLATESIDRGRKAKVLIPKLRPIKSRQQFNIAERVYYYGQSEEKKINYIEMRQHDRKILKLLQPPDDPAQSAQEFSSQFEQVYKELDLATTALQEVPQIFVAEIYPEQPFFKTFKNLDRQIEVEDAFNLPKRLNSLLLREGQNRNLTPQKHGLVLPSKPVKQVRVGGLRIGDRQGAVIGQGLCADEYRQVKHVDLSNNRLHNLINLPSAVTSLDLSHNLIGALGVIQLEKILGKNLKFLNLSYCELGESGGRLLLSLLIKENSLQRLDISGNSIRDGCAPELNKLLRLSQTLNELYLRYNGLMSIGGRAIFSAFLYNNALKVLDVSHNGLGGGSAMKVICETLRNKSCELTHLDLSYNHITANESAILQVSLQANHTLYGLHYEGNGPFYVNYQGFLNDGQPNQQLETLQPRIKGVSYHREPTLNLASPKDICWICEGWQQVKFVWHMKKSGDIKDEPIFVHLSFENWRPVMMEKQIVVKQQQGRDRKNSPTRLSPLRGTESPKVQRHEQQEIEEFLQVFKMCPPNLRVFYFYSNPVKNIQTHARDQIRIDAHQCLIDVQHIQFQDGSITEKQQIPFYNTMMTQQSYVCDDKEDYQPVVKVLPRDNERHYLLNKFQLVKRRANVILRGPAIPNRRKYDLMEAFELDLQYSRIPKMIRNDFDKANFKPILFGYYNGFRELFRQISVANYQMQGNEYQYSVPFKTFNKLIEGFGVIDDQSIKWTDIDLDMLSLKNNPDLKLAFNPDKALLRFQFMEIFVRIAQDKYIRNNQVKTLSEAIQRLFAVGTSLCTLVLSYDNPNEWRERRFYNKECRMLLYLKNEFLKDLFDHVCDITKKKWYFKSKWVTFQEALKFLRRINLMSELFNDRDLHVLVCQSIDHVFDDYTNEKSSQLQFMEFVELLARVADVISPTTLGHNISESHFDDRVALPLHVKLESLLAYIVQAAHLPKALVDHRNMFDSEINAAISVPIGSRINTFEATPAELTRVQQAWHVQTLTDDILGIPHSKGVPPQALLAYQTQFQTQYIPDSFWIIFRERDPSPIFLDSDSGSDSNRSSQGYQPLVQRINATSEIEEDDQY